MSFERINGSRARVLALAGSIIAIGVWAVTSTRVDAQQPESGEKNAGQRSMPHFYPDDPIWHEDDMRDIPPVAEFDLSKSYEFVHETFGEPVKAHGPALNVNTLGEVPDSSWFTNRLGQHEMTIDEIVRGPNQVDGPGRGIWHINGRPGPGTRSQFRGKEPPWI